MKTERSIAIVQSSYIPWKGYFDIIRSVDVFVLYDDVQYTRRDWRNRNKIKTAQGLVWLAIPVVHTERDTQLIQDTRVVDHTWRKKHWSSWVHHYGRAKHFGTYSDVFEALYLGSDEVMLSQINRAFIEAINRVLGIETRVQWSREFQQETGRSERLLSICKQAGATRYVSGPSAKEYLDEGLFRSKGVDVQWMDYSGYREYSQFHPPFEHGVSILDLLFHHGPDALQYMKSVR